MKMAFQALGNTSQRNSQYPRVIGQRDIQVRDKTLVIHIHVKSVRAVELLGVRRQSSHHAYGLAG